MQESGGNFPSGFYRFVQMMIAELIREEITVDEPLLTVDRQMGLVIVTPEGKGAKTVFKRVLYDAERDQSVVHCEVDAVGKF